MVKTIWPIDFNKLWIVHGHCLKDLNGEEAVGGRRIDNTQYVYKKGIPIYGLPIKYHTIIEFCGFVQTQAAIQAAWAMLSEATKIGDGQNHLTHWFQQIMDCKWSLFKRFKRGGGRRRS